MIVNKTILLISPEPWEHIFVSKHHYATHLAARGNKVYFLNPPNKENFLIIIQKTNYSNLHNIHYNGFVKGLRFLPNFLQHYLLKRKFNQLQEACGVEFDIVWSFDNSVFYDFGALPNSVFKISHIVDFNQNFNRTLATKTANICFGSSSFIVNILVKHNKNSFFINHGYNLIDCESRIAKLPGRNKIKVFYAGNLDIKYLDLILLDKIIEDNPTVDFIFAGKKSRKFEMISKSNVYYLGSLVSTILYSHMLEADILLICYQADSYMKQLSNPHKMMEYLGSGKVVLATKTMEYLNIANEGLIAMSDQNHEFHKLFKKIIDNLEEWNDPKIQQERRAIALNNTYDKQISRAEDYIKSINK